MLGNDKGIEGLAASNQVTEEAVSALLARELNQMSLEERGMMYEQLHGVLEIVQETPELIRNSLAQLDFEIIRTKNKAAYDQALHISSQYLRSPSFRLMFLRSVRFNVKEAAKRLVAFVDLKIRIFGPEVSARRIYLRDLDKDDMATLKSGIFQPLPVRDQAGRAVVGSFQTLIPYKPYKTAVSMQKVFLYMMLAMFEDDEEAQRNGIVGLLYFAGPHTVAFDHELHTRIPQAIDCMPVQACGLHFCSNSALVRVLKPLFMATMGRHLRARLRIHHGTPTECHYSLLTFGVPVDHLPITYEGGLKTTHYVKWLAKQAAREKAMAKGIWTGGIELPSPNDVLLGRGRTYQEFLGNVKMRIYVEARLEAYLNSNKFGKAHCIEQVLAQIRAKRGRFLKKRTDGWWEEVSIETAKEKVGMAFRTTLSVHKISTVNKECQKAKLPALDVEARHKRPRSDPPVPANPCCAKDTFLE